MSQTMALRGEWTVAQPHKAHSSVSPQCAEWKWGLAPYVLEVGVTVEWISRSKGFLIQ